MYIKDLTTLAVLVACVAAIPAPPTHAIHERRDVNPVKWITREKTPKTAVLPVRIGLTQRNLENGDAMLMDVADPASSGYAKHWTAEQVADYFAPAEETIEAVKEWLHSSGIHPDRIAHSDNKGWLAFDATAAEMEDLLHTEYYAYEHAEQGTTATSCEQYHVPKHVQKHVDYITPGVKLMAPVKRGHKKTDTKTKRSFGVSQPGPNTPFLFNEVDIPLSDVNDTSTCDQAITPACVAALYQIPAGNSSRSDNSMGIFEEGDYYAQEDLNLFFRNYTPGIPQNTHPKPSFIDGAKAPVPVKQAGGESDLDFELAYPILWPQTPTLYQTDDIHYATNPNSTSTGGFNTFLDAIDGSYCTYSAFGETGDDPKLDPKYPDPTPNGYKGKLQCGIYKPTNVISISYGGQEADLPAYYQQRQCNEFMKLGLQGVSIFYASGDDGVAGPAGDDGKDGCLKGGKVFSPAWPNSCPYVTNVGATKVYPGKTVTDPESAANDPKGDPYRTAFASGGGFSNIYPVPSYQQKAVSEYFANHKPSYPSYEGNSSIGANGGLYNSAGRGYPDVAANGDNIAVYNAGVWGTSGGTSASTPIFASAVNRINEERLNAGKKTIGFINPALYSNPQILNDIKNGSNPGCGTQGFSAVEGWDPVSGLGTPNFPKMLEYFMSLQ